MTVAHEIKGLFVQKTKSKDGKVIHKYRPSIITIWHNDPEKDGTDDSCGWFMRSRHGDKDVLARIVKRFNEDWDQVFVGSSDTYNRGWFRPSGMPNLSVQAIAINMFFFAACEHFGSDGRTNWKRAKKYIQSHLADILFFAENTTDSMRDGIVFAFGDDGYSRATGERRERMRKNRIERSAEMVYAWILRSERPWYKHPRWHIHHWKIQVHFTQTLKRWLFTRCCKCGKRFRWGESPVTNSWHGTRPKWFRGERDCFHSRCGHSEPAASEPASK